MTQDQAQNRPVGVPYQSPRPNRDGQGSIPYTPLARARRSSSYVGIDQATGLALGPDGFFHPIEVDAGGQLQIHGVGLNSILEEILRELKALRLGLVMAENNVCDDVDPDALPDDNDAWQ